MSDMGAVKHGRGFQRDVSTVRSSKLGKVPTVAVIEQIRNGS